MTRPILLPLSLFALLAGCGGGADPQPATDTTPLPTAGAPPARIPPPPPPTYLAGQLIRQEWATSQFRTRCAPIAFTDDAGVGGTPRAANFSGGWGVAFDLPAQRSAYGVAGPGVIAADAGPPYAQARRLNRQWPYFRELDTMSGPSFAGYGLEGARAYPPDNPDGTGEQSVANVRIHGQDCTYNIWSRLGRAHLMTLLDGLRLLPPAEN